MSRRLPDFISSFEKYAQTYNTTPLFAKYAAIWMVGTAVGRGVAMRARGNTLCPNFFIELVAGPGSGKSQAVSAARSVFVKATKMSIIPASITRAGLEDYMVSNLKTRKNPDGSALMSNECIGLSEEMQGILPDQDLGHLTLYNILYDLPSLHVAVTRSNGEVRLEAPYCSILTGAQPAFLATTMPEQAWGMGFMSRSILVFDTQQKRRSAFEHREVDYKLQADLIHDLKLIHETIGWMEWSPDAIALYEEWWTKNGGLPIPTAKRLAMGYNARRELHMMKLAMVMSLSESSDLIVQLSHVAKAIELLLLTEERMKGIFNEMAATGSMVALEEAIDLVRGKAAAGGSLDESAMIEFLMQRFPPNQVHAIVANLLASNGIAIAKGSADVRGCRKFTLGSKVNILG
jgi:hypothetical protein